MKVLIVEDDARVARLVSDVLVAQGMTTDLAPTGIQALSRVASGEYDLIIMDIGLPRMDGFAVIEELRKTDGQVPVLMLTARDSNDDIIRGLEAGADDYLTKPFDLGVLVARIEALVRRADRTPQPVLRFSDVVLDRIENSVKRDGRSIRLTPKEFEVLRLLLSNPDRIVSRDHLLSHVWQLDFDPKTNVVEVTVSRIRKKLEAGGGPRIIARDGDGYRLRTP